MTSALADQRRCVRHLTGGQVRRAMALGWAPAAGQLRLTHQMPAADQQLARPAISRTALGALAPFRALTEFPPRPVPARPGHKDELPVGVRVPRQRAPYPHPPAAHHPARDELLTRGARMFPLAQHRTDGPCVAAAMVDLGRLEVRAETNSAQGGLAGCHTGRHSRSCPSQAAARPPTRHRKLEAGPPVYLTRTAIPVCAGRAAPWADGGPAGPGRVTWAPCRGGSPGAH